MPEHDLGSTVIVRQRLRVTGVVQGVGFRPFVYRLAVEHHLHGFVGNDESGVFIEVEGTTDHLTGFRQQLCQSPPPLASIDEVTSQAIQAVFDDNFSIAASHSGSGRRTLMPPDVSVCDECLAEVDDPTNRRYRYPFTNCTDCGPRFTIIRDLPYDRPATSMASFPMCADCQSEYDDPIDRRYHAEPIACPACGPQLSLVQDGETRATQDNDAVLRHVQQALTNHQIVAIKGIGGYHLACDARSDAAVARLRQRKHREAKPFAVMVNDLATARLIAHINDDEAVALLEPARPIVLLRRRHDGGLSPGVAPGSPLLGVMVAYSPLHHLLFCGGPGSSQILPNVLVMTSGNVAGEPICTGAIEALDHLGPIADVFCNHDRPIEVPCDDSVVRVIDGVVRPLRRSRGYAPLPIELPFEVPPSLAVGAELKNTYCVAQGTHAWISQHMGDLRNLKTLGTFERSVHESLRMHGIAPQFVAADMHPGYSARRWAVDQAMADVIEVQHHHAHVAATMVDNGLDGTESVIGVVFDGTGYGTDERGVAQIWGGEFLVADYDGFDRTGHLRPLALPGGDGAIANPRRIAVAYLSEFGVDLDSDIPAVAACSDIEVGVVVRQVERKIGCVATTSMGRLFDAVSSILGICHEATYEAQAAIELEFCAAQGNARRWPLRFGLDEAGVLDPEPVVRGLLDGLRSDLSTADLAAAFHAALADGVRSVVAQITKETGHTTVALAGGVFQNVLLTTLVQRMLIEDGCRVLVHRLVPPNDAAISLGQLVIAARQHQLKGV